MTRQEEYSELCGLIRARFKTQADFARAIGISPSSLSKKLNNHSEWTKGQIERAREVLHFDPNDITRLFFYPMR